MQTILLAVVCLAIGAVLGYAVRGSIRKEIALVASEAGQVAQRLEDALRTDAHALAAEAEKLIAELRAKL